jgi:hypothetical protein
MDIQDGIDERVPGELEVLARLRSYEDPQITTHLYDFGSILLRESVEQTRALDNKAGLFTGFVGATIAVLLSTFPHWQDLIIKVPAGGVFLILGLLALLVAVFFSLLGLWPRQFEWIDEKELWFAQEYFSSPEKLRQYYLLGMYRATVSHDQVNQKKMKMLLRSQVLLVTGAAILAGLLLCEIWQLGARSQLLTLFEHFGWW